MQYLMHMQTPQYQDSISKQIDREKVSTLGLSGIFLSVEL